MRFRLLFLLILNAACSSNLKSMSLPNVTSSSVRILNPALNSVCVSSVVVEGECVSGITVHLEGSGIAVPVAVDCVGGLFSQQLSFTAGLGAKVVTVSQTDSSQNISTDSRILISGNLLTTSDTNLKNGSAVTQNYYAPGTSSGVSLVGQAGNPQGLWVLFPDPWGLTAGSGAITQTYSGSGSVVMNINLTGLNNTPVNAYPFIGLGGDAFGYHNGNQPPQFPARLSSMASLIFDVSYSVMGSYFNLADALFDLWLIPSAGYSAGPSGALEVEILPFCITPARAGTFVKTFVVPAIVNGNATTLSFDEYSSGSGAGNDVLFYPTVANGLSSAHIRFDALLFLNEAARTANLDQSWMNAGFNFGTEFGLSATQNYTFTISQLGIEQMMIEP